MHRFDRRRQLLAVALAALAGFTDALGFLTADGYFVSFMSGNTTRLGVNLARQPALAVLPALLLGGFVAGVAAGALVAGLGGPRRKPAVLMLVTVLLLAGAASYQLALHGLTLAFLVTAMGALNNTFQRDGEVSIGLTYMTGALVKLGQAIAARLLGRSGARPGGHLLLWAGLAGGAVLGALAHARIEAAALWLAALWAALTALAARRIPV